MGASPPWARGAAAFGVSQGVAGVTVNAPPSSGLGTDEDLENAGWVMRLCHRRRRIGGLRPGQPAQRRPERAGVLLEAGGWDRDPWISFTLAWGRVLQQRKHDWGYFAEPEATMDGPRVRSPSRRVTITSVIRLPLSRDPPDRR